MLLIELEVDCEIEDDVDRLPVERTGAELPLLDRVHSGLIESERKGLEDLHIADVAVLVDDALHDDDAGDARLARHLRVMRLDAADDHRRLDVAADAHRGLLFDYRHGVGDDAADHSAHHTTDDAAFHATFDATLDPRVDRRGL